MLKRLSDTAIVITLSLIFIALHVALLYYKGMPYLLVAPFALIIAFIAFTRIDSFYLLTIFSVPLAIPLFEIKPELSYSITLPTEFFVLIILFVLILKAIREKQQSFKLFLHPVSIAIIINLLWIGITSATSTMPVVSFKFFLSRVWLLTSFYVLAALLFNNKKHYVNFVWAYALGILIVIAYTINHHLSYGLFDQNASHFVMNPFFRDHTSYGAALAFLIPLFVGFLFYKDLSKFQKSTVFIILPIIVIAFVLSYSRAAWISVVFVVGILIVVVLRIRFWLVASVAIVIITLLALNWTEINYRMQSNTTDSSANLSEHVQSVTNITNDYSNVERLNRWLAAIEMYKERPVFGWGPGTYMFQYAPFQASHLINPTSTNSGDRGNAHSEYLGPLSESGFLGTITFVMIVILSLTTGFRVYRNASTLQEKILVLSCILSLITYLVHGIMNNFLDTLKISALFWGLIAFIVAMDIRQKEVLSNEINDVVE
ncbi:MAG: O-antigen ligase family protein [Bacteroidales bacterium]|nr:O-antigen ligase family protein [Bacteroidales bacterium]